MTRCILFLVGFFVATWFEPAGGQDKKVNLPKGSVLVRSARSGSWSDAATWEGRMIPPAWAIVQIRAGHSVLYDVVSQQAIRAVHIAGALRFSHDKNTRLDVGLIRIQSGDSIEEEGFDCDAHVPEAGPERAVLEVGTLRQPIQAGQSALIRLVYFPGMNQESLPAIVCCGGRMDFHGAPLSRTWVKLGATARAGQKEVILAEPVQGWRTGDRIILTATTRQIKAKKTFQPSVRDRTQTEEHVIQAVQGAKLILEQPLKFDHLGEGEYRGEAANLSRNVTVESADPKMRGHTMYHRGSAGSISYAEFRRLGKEGVLGRYSLHYHLVGDTMRGSSVIGASIWDSGNRWLTIHGTNFLVVRDCVGYQSLGHGFFLEDGTEVFNVLDRNLAVQAYRTKPLPKQIIPFDQNDGSGFWWANCRNSFTRNVACECDEYGYFFQAAKTPNFDPVLKVLQADGSRKMVDIRTLPFVRFDDNVTHCQRRHGFNLGGGVPFGPPNVDGIGPDLRHPLVVRNFKAYNVHWAIHPVSPSVLIEKMDIVDAEYGVWRPVYKDHAYKEIRMVGVPDQLRYAFVNPSAPPNLEASYPQPLTPIDDTPPITVITHVVQGPGGKVVVRGTTADNGTVARVWVNNQPARSLAPNFLEWETLLENLPQGKLTLIAHAEDETGNTEKMKHHWVVQ